MSTTMELTLEFKEQGDETGRIGPIEFTPPIDEEYWVLRVVVAEKQAVVGFPKFGTIGVGFAYEENWNTNLPFSSGTDAIMKHILQNKGDDSIDDADVRRAIDMVVEAAAKLVPA